MYFIPYLSIVNKVVSAPERVLKETSNRIILLKNQFSKLKYLMDTDVLSTISL